MGNTYCAGTREKIDDGSRATKEFCVRVADQVSRKYYLAKDKTKEQFYVAKLRTMGYSLNHFDDNGETKVITDFERRLPLRLVPLDQFDGFLQ